MKKQNLEQAKLTIFNTKSLSTEERYRVADWLHRLADQIVPEGDDWSDVFTARLYLKIEEINRDV